MLNTATKSEDNISAKLKVGLDFICIELRNKIIVNMMINIFSVKSVITNLKTTSCLLIYSARYFFLVKNSTFSQLSQIKMSTKAKKSLFKFKFKNNDIILLGRESKGVPEYIHQELKNTKNTTPCSTARLKPKHQRSVQYNQYHMLKLFTAIIFCSVFF